MRQERPETVLGGAYLGIQLHAPVGLPAGEESGSRFVPLQGQEHALTLHIPHPQWPTRCQAQEGSQKGWKGETGVAAVSAEQHK